MVWYEKAFLKLSCRIWNRWICLEVKLINKDFMVSVVLVYRPNDRAGGASVWEEILNLRAKIGSLMLVFGDFNEILNLQERKGNSNVLASRFPKVGIFNEPFGVAFIE